MFYLVQLIVSVTALLTSAKSTNISSSCDNIVINENCDGRYEMITIYDDVLNGADCQNRCNELNEAEFFSFYNEEVEPGWFLGYCACFTDCIAPSSDGYTLCIAERDETDDILERESVYCNCMRGPIEPSVDSCQELK